MKSKYVDGFHHFADPIKNNWRPGSSLNQEVERFPMLEQEQVPFDFHCPEMSDGLNYWRAKCEQRRRDPLQRSTCYPACKAEERRLRAEKAKKRNNRNGGFKAAIDLYASGMKTWEVAETLDIKPGTASRYKWLAKKQGLLQC